MVSENIVDLARYRRDGGGQPVVIDLWELAATGVTAQGRLAVGRTTKSDVALLLGLDADDITLEEVGVADLTWFEHQRLVWNLDGSGRFAGLHFGGQSDNDIPIWVQEAVARRTRTDEPIEAPPGVELWASDDIPVRLKGRRFDQFATITRFLGAMHGERPTTAVRGKEKWLQFEYQGEFGAVRAGFILKAFNLEEVEHFTVDYCLHGIGLIVPHEVHSQTGLVPLDQDDTRS